MDRAALAAFLRTRRQALQPEDVGLPRTRRRRAPGLRREEVAALAGMSTDYYCRIEQQRGPQPSVQVLTALAAGLRLSVAERNHLLRIAGYATPETMLEARRVSPGLGRIFARMETSPAEIITHLGETLAQNRLSTVIFGDRMGFTGLRRSIVYRWFTDPAERSRRDPADHDRQSRIYVSHLLTAHTHNRSDPRTSELIGALLPASKEFAALWREQPMVDPAVVPKRLAHPEVGPLELYGEMLAGHDWSQRLVVYAAEPGSPSEEKLQFLSVLRYELI